MQKPNCLTIKVTTYDADIEFETPAKSCGRELFNLVCTTFGIRETWYFGLQFIENPLNCATHGYCLSWWLKMDKKLSDIKKSRCCRTTDEHSVQLHFLFHVKFWVEDVMQDILLESTQYMYYLEIREIIIHRQDWFCPIELAILLASFFAQIEYGDIDQVSIEEGHLVKFVPQKLIGQCQLDIRSWEEKIKDHYKDHIGMTKAEAQSEILRLSQDLDMFGISYFQILNQTVKEGPKSGQGNWLGVSCFGLNFYEHDNKLKPVRQFGWNEIKHVSYKDRKFTIVLNENLKEPSCFGDNTSPFHFWTIASTESKQVLELCVGNHELYTRRRMPESLERQQMRVSAAAETERRVAERKGRERAAAAEAAANELRLALMQSEAAVGSLAERTRHTERELRQLIENQERQLSQMHLFQSQLLSEKLITAERARKFESAIMALSEEATISEAQRDSLKRQLDLAKKGESSLHEKLQSFLLSPGIWHCSDNSGSSQINYNGSGFPSYHTRQETLPQEFEDMPLQDLVAELEVSKRDFAERSSQFDMELKELRNKIHNFRISERVATTAFQKINLSPVPSLYPFSSLEALSSAF